MGGFRSASKPDSGTSSPADVVTPKLPPPAANAVVERSASDSDTRARAHRRTKAIPIDSTPSGGARPPATEPPARLGGNPWKKLGRALRALAVSPRRREDAQQEYEQIQEIQIQADGCTDGVAVGRVAEHARRVIEDEPAEEEDADASDRERECASSDEDGEQAGPDQDHKAHREKPAEKQEVALPNR